LRLCDMLFKGKAREICLEVFHDWEEKGYHLLKDERHHRYVYKRLKQLGLARRKALVNIHDTRKRRFALVPAKNQLLEICAQIERINEVKTSWFYTD